MKPELIICDTASKTAAREAELRTKGIPARIVSSQTHWLPDTKAYSSVSVESTLVLCAPRKFLSYYAKRMKLRFL
jgi:hypothetical protein